MPTLHLETTEDGTLRQCIDIGPHQLFADMNTLAGGQDSAPDPHDLFDASLAACKALTLMLYAKQHNIPLQRVSIDLQRDTSQERAKIYALDVGLQLIGALSENERQKLLIIADKCPIHKLMNQATINIHTHLITEH
jgi:putative redox protein